MLYFGFKPMMVERRRIHSSTVAPQKSEDLKFCHIF